MTKELKTCPWGCDDTAASVESTFCFFHVICKQCACVGPKALTKEDAIEAWNTRAPIEVTDALEEAAQLFQQYADHHDAKGQGHEHKVKRNQEMADKCKAALNNKEGSN